MKKQKVFYSKKTINDYIKMIKRKYKVRPSWKGEKGEKGKEVTLHPDWCEYNKIKAGDDVTIIANGVMVILPPDITEKREEEGTGVRAFR